MLATLATFSCSIIALHTVMLNHSYDFSFLIGSLGKTARIVIPLVTIISLACLALCIYKRGRLHIFQGKQ